MLRRISLFAILTAAGLAIAAPNYARAATTIGSNLAGSPTSGIGCIPNACTLAHSTLPGPSQAPGGVIAPSDGVVVRWRIKVGSVTAPAALRITRPGNSNTRTGAGTGPTENPPVNMTTPYDVRLPIQAGDALGLDCCGGASLARFVAGTASTTTRIWTPPLQDGEPLRPSGSSTPSELLINADIEADADHDGYGDETQDPCPTNAGSPGPCSNSFTLGGIARNKKKGTATITVTVPNPGELTGSGNGVKVASAAVTSKTVSGPGNVQLLIKAKGKKKRKLNDTGKVKLKVTITYTPQNGNPASQTVKVKLKKV